MTRQRRHRGRTHDSQTAEWQLLAEVARQRQLISEPTPAERPLQILFVCSRNQWRSPTAEQLWRKHPHVRTRSAGTRASARHRINAEDVRWADLILVMEDHHKAEVQVAFADVLQGKRIEVLNIPDEYQFMDPELIALLEQIVPPLLEKRD